jgi:PadR family transcriptional regulator, regulatory protein PadR
MLGRLEEQVIGAVLDLQADAYGVAIQRHLTVAGNKCALATVYNALERLEGKGLLCSCMSPPLRVRGGRARKVFSVTGDGEVAYREAVRASAVRYTQLKPVWERSHV